jgi:AraC-like DNA-binding protein
MAGYSKFHFLRIFRRHTGRSPHAYVDECRREAWLTMSASGMRVAAMAESLGFSHSSAFGRWLKRQGLSRRHRHGT